MNTNFFKKILRVPDFLSLPIAGLEISNNSIKYIEFDNNNGKISVKNFGSIPLVSNIVKDGDILNKDVLTRILSDMKNKITSDFIKVSIPEEKAYIFNVHMPKEAKKHLREALEFKIEENVPLKLSEVIFEYEIINDDKDSKEILVNVSVVPKNIIETYTEILTQAGFFLAGFEIESKMIANSVIPKDDMKNSVIIDIKDDSTLFIGVMDKHVRVTFSIPIGENTIKNNLLKNRIFEDQKAVDNFFESDITFQTDYNKELSSALINIFSILKDEAEKFNGYIVDKFPEKIKSPNRAIDDIILCGKSAILPGLARHINQNLNTEVKLASAWVNVFDLNKTISPINFNESLSFVTPIGLAISSYKENA